MKVRFWGVRGSFAMSGREYLRYGGNTTSMELVSDAGQRLLIDLGTGATELAKHLMAGEFGKGQGRLPILLSHTHLDHIQGLPFFTPFFITGNEIRIYGCRPRSRVCRSRPRSRISSIRTTARSTGSSDEPRGRCDDRELHARRHDRVARLRGDDGRGCRTAACGLTAFRDRRRWQDRDVPVRRRVSVARRSAARPQLALAQNADLLVHDAMHADRDYDLRRGWGTHRHAPA